MKKTIICISASALILLSGCNNIEDSSQALSQAEKTTTASTSSAITENTTTTEYTTAQTTENTSSETTTQATLPQTTTVSSENDIAAFSALSHFVEENAEYYVEYQAKHPLLEASTVVTYVNIGLNRPFYTGIKTIQDTGSLMVFCNKYNALPENYEPSDLTMISSENSISGRTLYLRKEAAEAFEKLCKAARAEGYTIIGQSAYRSYSYQKSLYDSYVASDGQTAADTYSARPGHSEHQTGLAIDVKNAELAYNQFGKTAEYQWAKDNIHKYGFVIHYIPNSEWITGYKTEEWHFRYVGISAATEIYQMGITLDEYLATYYV